jgi:hypothetical protein
LGIAHDPSGLLRAVLDAHQAHQKVEHSELEKGTAYSFGTGGRIRRERVKNGIAPRIAEVLLCPGEAM